MENPPLEDIFPIKNGDFPFSHVSFFGGVMFLSASSTTDSSKSLWVVWVILLWWLVGVFLQHPNLELKLFCPNSHRQQSGCFFFRVFNTCQEDMFSFGGSHESSPRFISCFFFRRVFFIFANHAAGWWKNWFPGFVPFDLHLGSLGPCYWSGTQPDTVSLMVVVSSLFLVFHSDVFFFPGGQFWPWNDKMIRKLLLDLFLVELLWEPQAIEQENMKFHRRVLSWWLYKMGPY